MPLLYLDLTLNYKNLRIRLIAHQALDRVICTYINYHIWEEHHS